MDAFLDSYLQHLFGSNTPKKIYLILIYRETQTHFSVTTAWISPTNVSTKQFLLADKDLTKIFRFYLCIKILIVERFRYMLMILINLNDQTHISPELVAGFLPSKSRSECLGL